MAVAGSIAAMNGVMNDDLNEEIEYNPNKERQRSRVLNLRAFQARTVNGVKNNNSIAFEESDSDESSKSNNQEQNSEDENDPFNKRKKELRDQIRQKQQQKKKKLKESIEMRLSKIQQQKKQLLINDVFMAIFAMVSLIISVVEYDDFFSNDGKERYEESQKGTILRSFSSVLTILTILLSIRHYYLTYLNYKKSGRLIQDVPFWKSYFMRYMLVEIFVISIHNLPKTNYIIFINNETRVLRYSVNAFIVLFMTVRIYLFLRLVARFTKWRTDHADLICQIEGFQANTTFALKAMLKHIPYQLLLSITMFISVVLGIAIRICEQYYQILLLIIIYRPYYVDEFYYEGKLIQQIPETYAKYQDYSFLWNGWWLVMVTMTTVGFGDYYAVTSFGRATTFLACYTGTFIVSMTMVTMYNSKDFSQQEKKSFVLLKRLTLRKNVNRLAGLSLLTFLKQVRSKNRNSKDPDNPIHKNDMLQFEETLERLIEQYKKGRQELPPEEVPQEEKIRLITEKVDGDIHRIGIELIENQKCAVAVEKIIESQKTVKEKLQQQLINFKRIQKTVGRLDFASKFGPLKVLTLTKQIEDQEQEVKEIQFAQRQKSEVLKRYKPIDKKHINSIIKEVSDSGVDLPEDTIRSKIQRIETVLEDLDNEEEKVSEYMSKSGGVTSRSSSRTLGGFMSRPHRLRPTAQFEIREQTEESVSLDDENEYGDKSSYQLESNNDNYDFYGKVLENDILPQKTIISNNILKDYSKTVKQQNIQDPNGIRRGLSFRGIKDDMSEQYHQNGDFSPLFPKKRDRTMTSQIKEENDHLDFHRSKSQNMYMKSKKKDQPFMINKNVKDKQKQYMDEQMNKGQNQVFTYQQKPSQNNDESLVIKRGTPSDKYQNLGNKYIDAQPDKPKQRKGYRPAYIEKQIQDRQKAKQSINAGSYSPQKVSFNIALNPMNQLQNPSNSSSLQNQVGNFANHYKNIQIQKQQEYYDMIKQLSIYGGLNDQSQQNQYDQLNVNREVKTRIKPSAEEMKQRNDNRSNIGAFNKALRQILKPPGP
eukprot:403360318